MKEKTGFGIIGTGAVAAVHAEAIRLASNAELIAVYDRDVVRAAAFAAKYGTEYCDTLEAFLARPDIDAVTIATPSGFHHDPAIAAARAGKHILCEKPMEITLERADEILQACEENHVLAGAVFQSRFTRPAQEIKKALAAGRFGQIIFASAQLHWLREPSYYQSASWRGTWAIDGGGALMNQGIHTVDMLLYLNGDVKSVSGRIATRLHKIETEDTAVAQLEFVNGSFGTLECSTACAPGFPKKLEIAGTLGNAVLEGDELKRWAFLTPQPEDDEIRRECAVGSGQHGGAGNPMNFSPDGHRRHIEDLSLAILHGKPLEVSGREGRRALELVRAIYESARSGKTVTLR